MKKLAAVIVLAVFMVTLFAQDNGRRRMTPLNTPATATQPVNETATDTAHINARRRAQSVSYTDDRGRLMYVDTITGEEWTDSTALKIVPKMQQPLFYTASAGLNLWDPVARAFGQNYGIASVWAELSLHNRYIPMVEIGLGQASHPGPNNNYRYRSPLSVFFKIGIGYNFLFNSNPDYKLYAVLRYGISPFSYNINDITLDSPYWQETERFSIPSQHATAGYYEFGIGLRTKVWGPISAGWEFRYHTIAHCTKGRYGDPWYIPGYGSRGSSLAGSFSIIYTLPVTHLNKKAADAVINSDNTVEGLLVPPGEPDGEGSSGQSGTIEE